MITYEAVHSSNVVAVGYDPETKEARVRFTSGAEYAYAGVSSHDYADLKSAPSVGEHLARVFKRQYQGVRQGEVETARRAAAQTRPDPVEVASPVPTPKGAPEVTQTGLYLLTRLVGVSILRAAIVVRARSEAEARKEATAATSHPEWRDPSARCVALARFDFVEGSSVILSSLADTRSHTP